MMRAAGTEVYYASVEAIPSSLRKSEEESARFAVTLPATSTNPKWRKT